MALARKATIVATLAAALAACATAPPTRQQARQLPREPVALRALDPWPIGSDEFFRTRDHLPGFRPDCPACTVVPGGVGLGIGSPSDSDDAGATMKLATGIYRCELNRSVTVRSIATDRSILTLNWQGRDFRLLANVTRSGALRYEDPGSGLTWLTIVGKSILLDSRRGRQLANDCRL